MRLYLLSFVFLLLVSSSCSKYRPAEPAFFISPAAIAIDTAAGQGSASHKITDLWFYVNGQFQGCYPAGGRIPVVSKNESVRISVRAGIVNNGISGTRIPWPFYDLLEFDTLVASGSDITRPFTFRYYPTTTFTLVEDFEGSVVSNFTPTDATFEAAPAADAREGKSMVMRLNSGAITGRVASGQAYPLPRNTSNVYLEFDYKCNATFIAGVIGDDRKDRPALVINPKPEWNKLYVQLGEAVSTEPASSKFNLYFQVDRVEGQPDEPLVYFDNIKLVYFK
jgi:hypothetical protein